MDKILTIQIPTYRNIKQLSDCLTSLMNFVEYPFKVVVINNDPLNSSREILESAVMSSPVDNLEVIHASTNLGWMAAHNLALKQCDTQYVMLANDDLVFMPYDHGFLRRLMRPFSNENVGAVGPISNFVMGSQNLWNLKLPTQHTTTLLIGFCVVIRSKVLMDIGGLDETLPGGDDFDWSIRIRDAGYDLVVDRTCYVHHIGQQTGRRVRRDWDNFHHQDLTINSLVRKHGVKKWYETFGSRVDEVPLDSKSEHVSIEHKWMRDKIPEGTGLNLGSGTQKDLGFAVDMSRKGHRGAGGMKFIQALPDLTADATKVPAQNNSLDYISASHLLEHLIDPVIVLREWKRALKPEGVLIMSIPNHKRIDVMPLDYTHKHAYDTDSIKSLLNITGWNVQECKEFVGGAFGVIANPIKE